MNEPQVIQTLISIAGAAALLIWAVRLVRTGVERGFATPMRVWLRHSAKNRLLAAGTGMGAFAIVFLELGSGGVCRTIGTTTGGVFIRGGSGFQKGAAPPPQTYTMCCASLVNVAGCPPL